MKVRRFLKHFTVEQRIRELALRPDRADVIIPALDIYLKIMKWAGIRKIYVPQVGLADGIVRTLVVLGLKILCGFKFDWTCGIRVIKYAN